MRKITEERILALIAEKGGAVGSRELALALGVEHGVTAKVVPELKRMERRGLVVNSSPAGNSGLNETEATALRTAITRLPTAMSFWVLRKIAN